MMIKRLLVIASLLLASPAAAQISAPIDLGIGAATALALTGQPILVAAAAVSMLPGQLDIYRTIK